MTERIGDYEVHPFAAEFPLMEGDEFTELVDDVKRNGLRDPIILSHDRKLLIDGRNRLRACIDAGVDVVYEKLGGHYTELMILDLIMSLNVNRRQLNPGQKAMAGMKYVEYVEKAVQQERIVTNGSRGDHAEQTIRADRRANRSDERVAKMVGASGRSVQRAKKVSAAAPDLAAKVRSGEVSLDSAYNRVQARERAMPKPEPVKAGPVMLTLRTHTGEEVPYPKPQAKATFNSTPGDGISWADWSWNPVTGCLHGCNYCYAREIATSDRFKQAYPVGFTPLFHHERLDAPANTTLPTNPTDAQRRVFVCSMADLYGRWVPQEWIDQVHAAELASPQWQYIHLTKFPDRYVGFELPQSGWIGTSVDEQKRVRIAERAFSQISGVAVKWLSLEPLKEPLEFSDLSVFDWVVIGAQTETYQPNHGVMPAFAPPFEWVARIVAQAREAGCKIHLKPNLLGKTGPAHPGMQLPNEYPASSVAD